MLRSTIAALAGLIFVNPAMAGYDSNLVGQVVSVSVASLYDTILFRLHNQPLGHNGCDNVRFAISKSIPADRRKAMLARLLLAYATKENINIGYAGTGDCADGYINVYNVG